VAPDPSEKEPTLQLVHSEAPIELDAVPLPQEVQTDIPISAANVPISQLSHCTDFGFVVTCPGSHLLHSDCLAPLLRINVPAGQALQ
jgi:hypothetical protein